MTPQATPPQGQIATDAERERRRQQILQAIRQEVRRRVSERMTEHRAGLEQRFGTSVAAAPITAAPPPEPPEKALGVGETRVGAGPGAGATDRGFRALGQAGRAVAGLARGAAEVVTRPRRALRLVTGREQKELEAETARRRAAPPVPVAPLTPEKREQVKLATNPMAALAVGASRDVVELTALAEHPGLTPSDRAIVRRLLQQKLGQAREYEQGAAMLGQVPPMPAPPPGRPPGADVSGLESQAILDQLTVESITARPDVMPPREPELPVLDGAAVGEREKNLTDEQFQSYLAQETERIRRGQEIARDPTGMGGPIGVGARAAFELWAGARELTEQFRHPLNADARRFARMLEEIRTGGGLTGPLDTSLIPQTAYGFINALPELAFLGSVGAFRAGAWAYQPIRLAAFGAIRSRYPATAAARLMDAIGHEVVMFGTAIGAYEATLGHGAGMPLGERFDVGFQAGLESGLMAGIPFGIGKGVLRELARAYPRTWGQGYFRPRPRPVGYEEAGIPPLQEWRERQGIDPDQMFMETLSAMERTAEFVPTPIRGGIQAFRGGVNLQYHLPMIRADRARVAQELDAWVRQAPLRARAYELAASQQPGGLSDLDAMAQLRAEYEIPAEIIERAEALGGVLPPEWQAALEEGNRVLPPGPGGVDQIARIWAQAKRDLFFSPEVAEARRRTGLMGEFLQELEAYEQQTGMAEIYRRLAQQEAEAEALRPREEVEAEALQVAQNLEALTAQVERIARGEVTAADPGLPRLVEYADGVTNWAMGAGKDELAVRAQALGQQIIEIMRRGERPPTEPQRPKGAEPAVAAGVGPRPPGAPPTPPAAPAPPPGARLAPEARESLIRQFGGEPEQFRGLSDQELIDLYEGEGLEVPAEAMAAPVPEAVSIAPQVQKLAQRIETAKTRLTEGVRFDQEARLREEITTAQQGIRDILGDEEAVGVEQLRASERIARALEEPPERPVRPEPEVVGPEPTPPPPRPSEPAPVPEQPIGRELPEDVKGSLRDEFRDVLRSLGEEVDTWTDERLIRWMAENDIPMRPEWLEPPARAEPVGFGQRVEPGVEPKPTTPDIAALKPTPEAVRELGPDATDLAVEEVLTEISVLNEGIRASRDLLAKTTEAKQRSRLEQRIERETEQVEGLWEELNRVYGEEQLAPVRAWLEAGPERPRIAPEDVEIGRVPAEEGTVPGIGTREYQRLLNEGTPEELRRALVQLQNDRVRVEQRPADDPTRRDMLNELEAETQGIRTALRRRQAEVFAADRGVTTLSNEEFVARLAAAETAVPRDAVELEALRGDAQRRVTAAQNANEAVPYEIVDLAHEPLERQRGDRGEIVVRTAEGEQQTMEYQYVVYDLADPDALGMPQGSHRLDPGGRKVANQRYLLKYAQPRGFTASVVLEQSRESKYNPNLFADPAITATEGPPVTDPTAHVLAGNHRFEMARLVYGRGQQAAKDLKARIKTNASKGLYGKDIKATDIGRMKQPVVVRELVLPPEARTTESIRRLGADMNRGQAEAMQKTELAVTQAQYVSRETMEFFGEQYAELTDPTLRKFLATTAGQEWIDRLVKDGALPADQVGRLMERGELTEDGKDFLEHLMLGHVVGDPALVAATPSNVRARLMASAGDILAASTKPDWDLRPTIREAIAIMRAAREEAGFRDAYGYLKQPMLGDQFDQFSAAAKQLAYWLDGPKSREFSTKVQEARDYFRRYRRLAEGGLEEGQEEMFGAAFVVEPVEAFSRVFGDQFLLTSLDRLVPEARPYVDFAEPPGPAAGPKLPEALREQLRNRIIEKYKIPMTDEARERLRLRAEEIRRAKEPEIVGPAPVGVQPPPPGGGEGVGGRPGVEPAKPEGRKPAEPTEAGVPTEGRPTKEQLTPEERDIRRKEREKARREKLRQERDEQRQRDLEQEREKYIEVQEDQDLLSDVNKIDPTVRQTMYRLGEKAGIDRRVIEDQLRDAAKIEKAEDGFLLANAAGTGKTYVTLSTIKNEIAKAQTAGRGHRTLILLPNTPLLEQWRGVAAEFDLELNEFKPGVRDGVWTISYAKARESLKPGARGEEWDWGKFDLVVFDEAQAIANVGILGERGSLTAQVGQRLMRPDIGAKVVLMSATPFEFPWQTGFLTRMKLWGEGTPYRNWDAMLRDFGVRKVVEGRKVWYQFTHRDTNMILRDLVRLRRYMTERGSFAQRAIKVDQQLKNRFVQMPFPDEYREFYGRVMGTLHALLQKANPMEKRLLLSFRTTLSKRIFELAKMVGGTKDPTSVVSVAKDLVEQGRSVIVMVAYKKDFSLTPETAARFPALQDVFYTMDEEFRRGLQRLVEDLGGKDQVALLTGDVGKAARLAAIDDFQNGRKFIFVGTADAAGTGLSLHADRPGARPRAQVNVSLPWQGRTAEQMVGRGYRLGSRSDVDMIWMAVNAPIERVLIERVAMKMYSMGALVEGAPKLNAQKLMEFDFMPPEEALREMGGKWKRALGEEFDGEYAPIGETPTVLDRVRPKTIDVAVEQFTKDFIERFPRRYSEPMVTSAAAVNDIKAGPPIADDPMIVDSKGGVWPPGHDRDIVRPWVIAGRMARRLRRRMLVGGIKGKGVMGRFYIVPELIRLRKFGDLPTAVHEFGHYIDKALFGFIGDPSGRIKGPPKELLPFLDEVRALAYPGAVSKQAEGFAEFLRYYITDRPRLEKATPRFLEFFEARMKERAPRDLETLTWVRSQYSLMLKQPAMAQVMARVARDQWHGFWQPVADAPDEWLTSFWDARLRSTFNYMHKFRTIDKFIRKQNPDMPLIEPAARAILGSDGMADMALRYGVMDARTFNLTGKFEPVSPSLTQVFETVRRAEAVTPIGTPWTNADKFNGFRAWLVARRARELMDQGKQTGFEEKADLDAVDATIAEVNAQPGLLRAYEEAWGQLDRYQEAWLDALVAFGKLTPALKTTLRKMHQMYIPFYRLMGEPDFLEGKSYGDLLKGIGGVAPAEEALFRLKGSSRPVIDPLLSIVENTRFFSRLVMKARVEQRIAQFIDRKWGIPGGGKYFEEVDPLVHVDAHYLRTVINALRQLGLDVEGAEGLSEAELKQLVMFFRPATTGEALAKDVFSAKIGNRTVWYKVHDPDLYTAMRGMTDLELGAFGTLLQRFSRTLRHGVVIHPGFWVRNAMRDAQTAFIQSKYGSISPLDIVRGMMEQYVQSDVWRDWMASGGARNALVYYQAQTNMDILKQLGQKLYGARDVVQYRLAAKQNVVNSNEAALTSLKAIAEDLRDIKNFTLGFLDVPSAVIEQGPRVAAYKKARAAGAPWDVAAMESADITVDFRLHGSSTLLRKLTQTTAFMNPALQGVYRFGKEVADRPVTALARSVALSGLSLAAWTISHNDPDTADLSRYLRHRYWIFRVGMGGGRKMFLRFPKTWVYGDIVPSLLMESMLDWIDDRDPQFASRLYTTIKQSFGFPIIPTAFSPIFEVLIDRSLYFDRPLVGDRLEALPADWRAAEFTAPASISIARAWNQLLDHLPAELSNRLFNRKLAPVQVDHVIRNWFGTFWYELYKSFGHKISGEDVVLPGTPFWQQYFLRDFTIDYPSTSAEIMREFYDKRDIALGRAVEQGKKEFEGWTSEEERLWYEAKYGAMASLAPIMAIAAGQLSAIASRRREAETYEERQAQIREAIEVARLAVQYYDDVLKGALPEEREALKRLQTLRAIEGGRRDARQQVREEIETLVVKRQLAGATQAPESEIDAIIGILERHAANLEPGDIPALLAWYKDRFQGGPAENLFWRSGSRQGRMRALVEEGVP